MAYRDKDDSSSTERSSKENAKAKTDSSVSVSTLYSLRTLQISHWTHRLPPTNKYQQAKLSLARTHRIVWSTRNRFEYASSVHSCGYLFNEFLFRFFLSDRTTVLVQSRTDFYQQKQSSSRACTPIIIRPKPQAYIENISINCGFTWHLMSRSTQGHDYIPKCMHIFKQKNLLNTNEVCDNILCREKFSPVGYLGTSRKRLFDLEQMIQNR